MDSEGQPPHPDVEAGEAGAGETGHKDVEPRESSEHPTDSILDSRDSRDQTEPLLNEKNEAAKSPRELRVNEDAQVCSCLVPGIFYVAAFLLGLCMAMVFFADNPQMGSTLASETPGFLSVVSRDVQRRQGKTMKTTFLMQPNTLK